MRVQSFLMGLSFLTVLSLVYVQQRVVLVTEGYRVEALRDLRDDLLDQYRVLNYNVLTLQSPVILSKRLEGRGVPLTSPQRIEVVARQWDSLSENQQGQFLGRQQPSWIRQARKFAFDVLGMGRQAEAEPVFDY